MSVTKKTSQKRRRKPAKRTVVDSAARNAACLNDGCNPELVEGAKFDGVFEMPVIKKPRKIIIPENLVPFSKMDKADPASFAVCAYENDTVFRELLINPNEYVEKIKAFQGFITPDCSLYRDMPLAIQITNIYRNRAIGYYFQKKGVYVIPCVRWGDERTYTSKMLPEKVAFAGVEKQSIVSIGSYGQLKDKVNRYYFEAGLDSMLETLEPKVVLIYGKMPDDIEKQYPNTLFKAYPDWTSIVRNN